MDAPDPDAQASSVVPFSAVVLAGGRGTRLGGADKATLDLDGATLLQRSLAALVGATEVVVVGDPVPGPLPREVRFAREQPRWGGPAAALLAGIAALAPSADGGAPVVVLAVDMPRVESATVARLLAAASPPVDGAVLVDETGRRQLAFAFDRTALATALPGSGSQAGLPLHRLLSGLRLAEVAGTGDEARDVDTWDDLRGLSQH